MDLKRRRYPRILVGKGLHGKISGIDAYWPDGKKTGVVDISYVGVSVLSHKDPSWDLTKGSALILNLHFLENNVKVQFECEVVRQDDRCTAVHFPNLSPEARQALKIFMEPKILALNTRYVDPKFYVKEQGFNYWYHGPNQTNIYVWGDKKKIKRCTVELEGHVLNIEDGRFFESAAGDYLRVPTEDYSYQVNHAEEKKTLSIENPLVKKVTSFLSQVNDAKGIIEKVLELIK